MPIPVPAITGSFAGDQIRFADPDDGWVYNDENSGPGLWVTHDGGADWRTVTIPGVSNLDSISDVEAADGRVFAAFNGAPILIASSPVSFDDWTVSPTTLEVGAGPIPFEQIVLHGPVGWVAEVDRTVIAGASLVGGSWEPWTPPCAETTGPMYLAASDVENVAAVCPEGAYGGPTDQVQVGLFVSNNGGSTFVPSGETLPEDTFGPIATAGPGVVVMGVGGTGLLATFDGGAQWSTVYASSSEYAWQQVGFTTPTQGVAIDGDGTMLMTYDGGHQWYVVNFPSVT